MSGKRRDNHQPLPPSMRCKDAPISDFSKQQVPQERGIQISGSYGGGNNRSLLAGIFEGRRSDDVVSTQQQQQQQQQPQHQAFDENINASFLPRRQYQQRAHRCSSLPDPSYLSAASGQGERGSLPSHWLHHPPPSSLSAPPSVALLPRYDYSPSMSFSPRSPIIDSYSHSSFTSGVSGQQAQPPLSSVSLSTSSPAPSPKRWSCSQQPTASLGASSIGMGNRSTRSTTARQQQQAQSLSSSFTPNSYDKHERYFKLAAHARQQQQQQMEWDQQRQSQEQNLPTPTAGMKNLKKCSNLTVLMEQQQQCQLPPTKEREGKRRDTIEQSSSSPTDEQSCRELKQGRIVTENITNVYAGNTEEKEEKVLNLKLASSLSEKPSTSAVGNPTNHQKQDKKYNNAAPPVLKSPPTTTAATNKRPSLRSHSISSYHSSYLSSSTSSASVLTDTTSTTHERSNDVTTIQVHCGDATASKQQQSQNARLVRQPQVMPELSSASSSSSSFAEFASKFDKQLQLQIEEEQSNVPANPKPEDSDQSGQNACKPPALAASLPSWSARRSSTGDVTPSYYSRVGGAGGGGNSLSLSNHGIEKRGYQRYKPTSESSNPLVNSSIDNPSSYVVRRCVSNKELGCHPQMQPLSAPDVSTSPYKFMLYQKDKIEAAMHQRLVTLRENASPATAAEAEEEIASSAQQQQGRPPSSNGNHHHRLSKQTRNKRRAEHNQAVIDDLCEIVCELLVAESKLLNPQSYPFHHSLENNSPVNESVQSAVRQFLSDLPPRYALGIDTPSEVLVHMRLMAAARADNTRAAVHIVNVDNHLGGPSSFPDHQHHHQGGVKERRATRLVTISCGDVDGLLEYITRLLGTGGSRVLDADVMLSKDNIALDRFVVEMTGRLRLDKLQHYIESYLEEARQQKENFSASSPSPLEEREIIASSSMFNYSNAPQQQQQQHSQLPVVQAHATTNSATTNAPSKADHHTYGPLYFNPPTRRIPESPRERLHEEMQTAVPLSEVVASNSSALLSSTSTRSIPGSPIRQLHTNSATATVAAQQSPPTRQTSGECGHEGGSSHHHHHQASITATTADHPRRRQLLNREARNLSLDGENEVMGYVNQQPSLSSRSNSNNNSNGVSDAMVNQYLTTAEEQDRQDGQYLSSFQQQQHDRLYNSPTPSIVPSSRDVPIIPFDELMLIETLGEGRVSTIYRAAWTRGVGGASTPTTTRVDNDGVAMVALKVATTNNPNHHQEYSVGGSGGDYENIEELQREADIAAMLHHNNICDLVGVAYDAECFCLAYDYCEGGSLLSLLSDTSRCYEYLPIALDIANGMAYLHSRNVIHRDLKPSNILLTKDNRAKIADFGMSVANTGQELTAETGTYRWMAPEVIRHESYSSNADVYSFGLVLWQLITREVPFATMTPIQAAYAVAQGHRPDIPSSTPEPLKRIIRACWDADSHRRPSFTYIAMALADYAKMAFNPANVGAQTVQIANDMLANVPGNATVNVDFSAPVSLPSISAAGSFAGNRGNNDSSLSRSGGSYGGWFVNQGSGSYTGLSNSNIGLEI